MWIKELGRKLQVGGEKYEYNDVVLSGKIKHFKYSAMAETQAVLERVI